VDDSGTVWFDTSLALDSRGYPRITYYDDTHQDLKYASWNGSSWEIQTPDSQGSVGRWNSLALDSSGYPCITYYDSTNRRLKYAEGAPEPSTLLMVGLGLAGLVAWRRRVRRP